jgi:hypothetical protein
LATITYPVWTVTDDSGNVVTGATVTVTSVKDKAGTDISTPGATVNQSGANVSIDYDAETKGDAWVVLAVSKSATTFTGLNAAPAFYLTHDPSRVQNIPASGTVITAGTGTGQLSVSGGVGQANVVQVNGTAVTTSDGTAQAGASTTITLASADAAGTNAYVREKIRIVAGTGIGQSRIVTAYNSATKVATVDRAWDTTPDSTSQYTLGDTADAYSLTNQTANLPADVQTIKMQAVTATAGFSYDAQTTAQGTIASNLNATVSSRLATAGYTAPDNADIVTALADLVTLLGRTDPTTALTAIQTAATAIKAKTDALPADPASATNVTASTTAVNAHTDTAVSPLATSATQTTILNRLGAFTGSGINTVLGFFKALLRKDAALTPSDVGGTFDNTTDSNEAIRDRGDAAWTTGSGGAGGTDVNVVSVAGVAVTSDTAAALTSVTAGKLNVNPAATGSLT